jgi:hypothetical protein
MGGALPKDILDDMVYDGMATGKLSSYLTGL